MFRRFLDAEHGSSLIKFAAVLPVMLLLIMGVIDFSRYFAIYSVLQKGAEDGVRLAATLPNFETDIRGLDPESQEFQNFENARQRVLEETVSFPLRTLLSDHDDLASSAKLLTIASLQTIIDPTTGAVIEEEESKFGAAVLRPGERVLVYTPDGEQWVEHSTRPPDAAGVPPNVNAETLIQTDPIETRLYALFKPITPLLPELTVSAHARRHRKSVPKTDFARNPEGTPIDLPKEEEETTTTTTTTSTTTTTVPDCVENWDTCVDDFYCPFGNPFDDGGPEPFDCECVACDRLDGFPTPEDPVIPAID